MEELYMTIIKIFTVYGWQLTVLAVSGIFLLGVLKSVKAFDWIWIYAVEGEEKILLGLLKHFKVLDKIIVSTKEKYELGEIV